MSDAITETRNWIEKVVIGLNLCPFADRVFRAGRVDYRVCTENSPASVIRALAEALLQLHAADRGATETSFLIFPHAAKSFEEFLDLTDTAEDLVAKMGLRGEIQVVGFHPNFQFEGTTPDAAENYTYRSPYPMLHLLREVSISELPMSQEELGEIPRRNTARLNALTPEERRALFPVKH